MTPFHDGEIQVQLRAGVREKAEKAARIIRDHMPDQHRIFFEHSGTLMMAGILDTNGHPWATPFLGAKGFVRSPSPNILQIKSRPLAAQSEYVKLTDGDKIGLLGIELSTRRRNRANGFVQNIDGDELTIFVEQSFGNCAKFIQQRDMDLLESYTIVPNISPLIINDSRFQTAMAQTDTLFIATRTQQLDENTSNGADVSHRGGLPGFARLVGDELYVPDFAGNNFFNTFGNIISDSRVGIFIPNFIDNEVYWIQGRAEILWGGENIEPHSDALRTLKVTISHVFASDGSQPLMVSKGAPVFSPALLKRSL